MVGDQHPDAARLEETDDALDLDHRDRVDAGEGFVQQDEARVGGQGARDFHPAALATRQRRGGRVAQVVHVQVFEQRVQPRLDGGVLQRFAGVVELQFQHRTHVLGHAELAEDRRFLRQVAQPQAGAAVDGQALDGLAVQQDLPGVVAQQANQHVERGGLAGAVGAQQAHDFTLVHGQRHVLDHLAAAVGLLQAAGFQTAATFCPVVGGAGIGGNGADGRETAHGRPSPSWPLGLSGAGLAAGAAGASALGTGVNMARTRPEGFEAVRLPGPPSTLKVSLPLL